MIQASLFLAQTPAAQPQSSPFNMFWPMILIFVMMYFLMIRPQRKKQAELQQQINNLRGGDTVVTSGGLHGLVVSVQDRTVTLKIADNVKVKVEKSGVAGILKKSSEPDVIEADAEVSPPDSPPDNKS
ncbi:MAG: preprotein translocase subunit YajC [Verrucomicrobiales bacterium]